MIERPSNIAHGAWKYGQLNITINRLHNILNRRLRTDDEWLMTGIAVIQIA